MQTTNGDLIGAHTALVRMGEADLPSGTVGFRFALNRNHMKPVVEALEETRMNLAKEHGVADSKKATETNQDEWRLQMEAFQEAWTVLLKEQAEWESPATVDVQKIASYKLKANDILAAYNVGILVGDLVKVDTEE